MFKQQTDACQCCHPFVWENTHTHTHTHTHERLDPTFTLAGFNLGCIEEPLSNGSTIISIMWNTSSVKFGGLEQIYLLQWLTGIASDVDSESEISLAKVKKGVFFNEVSCFVCQRVVSGLNYVLLLTIVPFLYFCLSGESATAAPQPNSEYRQLILLLPSSSPLPLPLISNLIPFPFLLFISNPSVVMHLTKQIRFYGRLLKFLINIFPLKCKYAYKSNMLHEKCLPV